MSKGVIPDSQSIIVAVIATVASACGIGSNVTTADVVYVGLNRDVRTSYDLDLNQDGRRDYFATWINACRDCWEWIGPYEFFAVQGYRQPWQPEGGVTNNGIVSRNGQVALLPPGEIIHLSNPTLNWVHGFGEQNIEGITFFPQSHDPNGPRTGYLGVHFEAADGFHYGWIQVQSESWSKELSPDSLTIEPVYNPAILAWAYETTPNAPIIAGAVPEPATRVLVLAAAAMVAGWKFRSRLLPFLICSFIPVAASGEIVYRSNSDLDQRLIDLDSNGTSDFRFWSMPDITLTIEHIISSVTGVDGFTSSGILVSGANATLMDDGAAIGPAAAPGSGWQRAFMSHELSRYSDHAGWSGDWDHAGEGIIGVSFQSDLGLHYGWIRLNLNNQFVPMEGAPGPLQGYLRLGPIVHDWAYESAPDTPIVAGAIPEPEGFVLLLAGLFVIAVLLTMHRTTEPCRTRVPVRGGKHSSTTSNSATKCSLFHFIPSKGRRHDSSHQRAACGAAALLPRSDCARRSSGGHLDRPEWKRRRRELERAGQLESGCRSQ